MNLVELAKLISEGQTATSYESKIKIIYKDMGFYEVLSEGRESINMLPCDVNYLCIDDWEIDPPFVDFWTAWQASKEGWAIISEYYSYPRVHGDLTEVLTTKMIDGRWQILK